MSAAWLVLAAGLWLVIRQVMGFRQD